MQGFSQSFKASASAFGSLPKTSLKNSMGPKERETLRMQVQQPEITMRRSTTKTTNAKQVGSKKPFVTQAGYNELRATNKSKADTKHNLPRGKDRAG